MLCVETLFVACGTIGLIGSVLVLLMVAELKQDFKDS